MREKERERERRRREERERGEEVGEGEGGNVREGERNKTHFPLEVLGRTPLANDKPLSFLRLFAVSGALAVNALTFWQ